MTTTEAPEAPAPPSSAEETSPASRPLLRRLTERPALLATACLFLFVFGTSAVWAVSTPPFGSPDESAHTIRAVSIWEGDFEKKPLQVDGLTSFTDVRVPEVFAESPQQLGCWIFQSDKTPSCTPGFSGSPDLVTTTTTAGMHPHLFYALVGWIGAVHPTAGGMYMMRLFSALLCALMVAPIAATLVAERRSRLVMLGALVGLTPVALFLCGSINPNGFEICTGIALWVHGSAFARRFVAGEHISRSLVVCFSTAAFLMSFIRPLSPAFTVLILLVIVSVNRCNPVKLLRSRTGAIPVVAALAGFGLASWWLLYSGMLSVQLEGSPGENTAIKATAGAVAGYYQQMIAAFGWLDAGIASVPMYTWLLLALGGLALALGIGSTAERRGAVAVLALSWIVPVAAQYNGFETNGLVWQGRYSLPLVAGFPFLAMLAVDRGGRLGAADRRRLVRVLGATMLVGHVGGYYWAMRRFTVSLDGSLWYLGEPEWKPPTAPLALLLIGFVVVSAVGLAATLWSSGLGETSGLGEASGLGATSGTGEALEQRSAVVAAD